MQRVSFYLAVLGRKGSCMSLLFIVAYMSACQNKLQKKQWENASIDSTITSNITYKQLDKESEVFSVGVNQDTSKKRTSGVLYFTKGHVNLSDSTSARMNNCRAFFSDDNILSINVGIGNGFGGWGFVIHYTNKKFYTEPSYSTDAIPLDEPEPVFKVIYQRLTLNKPEYKLGDSLYGKIDFKVLEIDKDSDTINHSGNGYFRTIVKEL